MDSDLFGKWRKYMDQTRIGTFIAVLRKEKGLTQKELAEQVRSSMLGRKKKTTKKDTDDDIEFIDL